MTIASHKIWREDDLLAIPKDGCKHELIAGEIHTMSPAGFDHGAVCIRISAALATFADQHDLGVVCEGQTGFYMKNGDLLQPDVSFVTNHRASAPDQNPQKFFRGSPDLAVEVLSPSEPRKHIDFKINSYLENDTQIVWVVNPPSRTVTVYVPHQEPQTLSADQLLTAPTLLPGFSLPIAAIFGRRHA